MVCLSRVEYNVQLCIPSARLWMHNPALNKKKQCVLKKKQKERIWHIKAMEEEPSIMLDFV